MNELIVCLTTDEQILIGNELDKLFTFQDRPLSVQKRTLFVQELSSKGFSFDAMVKGIRALFSEELREVKLWTVEKSIREFIPKKSFEEVDRKLKEIAEKELEARRNSLTVINGEKRNEITR